MVTADGSKSFLCSLASLSLHDQLKLMEVVGPMPALSLSNDDIALRDYAVLQKRSS